MNSTVATTESTESAMRLAAIEPIVVASQMAASSLDFDETARQIRETEWQAQSAAAILDLLGRLCDAPDLLTACHTLAAELREYLGCDRVAIGLRRGRNDSCWLAAVSGVADLDPRSDAARSLEIELDESLSEEGVIGWPAQNDRDKAASPTRSRRGLPLNSPGMLSAPLRTVDGATVGAWLFLGSEQFANDPQNRRFIEACSPSMAAGLRLRQTVHAGPVLQFARRLVHAIPVLRGKALWAVAAVVALAMFIPWPYRVSVECETQPVVRRYVAAPFAGEFEKSFVKPGDLVQRGQPLGRMEGRDVRWELAGLTADQRRAQKSRDANMAHGKTAAAQIDQLDADRLEVKRRILENRLKQLEICSPIDGIVISGDLERSQGVPISVGQVLFEVAPLDRMVAELAIPDDEISHVETEMPATLWLDAFQSDSRAGTIARIHPRSLTREKDNVFIAEVPLDNGDQALRPGMKGAAKISTSPHALGWIIFHKPWNWLVSWLGW